MSYLGLDIGTSGCKAVAFNREGRPIASAAREYAVVSRQTDWAELDSREVGDACLAVLAEAAGRCVDVPVVGLAISSQGEAFTILNEEGEVIANAMVSSDLRAIRQVESSSFDEDELYKKTGHTPYPLFSLYKLLWLREERPEIWKNAARILCFEDYLHFLLGLDPAISFSLAGRTMLFNVREQRWDREILGAIGLSTGQLSRPLASGQLVGILSDAICEKLNFATGAIVVAGGHDQVCTALGCGAIRSGIAVLGSGTVECITAAFSEPVLSHGLREANLCTYSHAAPGLFATLAYNLSGGNVLQWFRDEWAANEIATAEKTGEEVYELIQSLMPDSPTSLMVLPYFTSSGTPHFDNHTPAAILGLRLTTTRGEVLRALLEGLCFELKMNLRILQQSGIHIEELRVTGGGAKNRKWLQMKSDVFDLPIRVSEVIEAGCLGTAMLVCAAREKRDVQSLVEEWVGVGELFSPNSQNAAYYHRRADLYKKTYASLKSLGEMIF